jgi:hypothetical protein
MGDIATATGRQAAAAPAPAGTVAVPQNTMMEAAQATYQHTLDAKIRYAKTLAASGLLPKVYHKNPANILWALEYGQALGISPMAAMIGIHVIEGKPCAGAGLISGLVQNAGHRLRVKGDDKTATCEIMRSDDQSFTFVATWTWDRAVKAGLTGKSVWKQYPAAMLRARAITEAARAACQDVLYGLAYTPEELGADSMGDYPADLSASQPAAPAGDLPEMLAVVATHYRRLGVTDEKVMLEHSALLVDRHLASAVDIQDDEVEHLLTELEGCESPADLARLLAEQEAALQ